METYMTPEREEYINKLDNQIQAINRIMKMDSGTVVSTELKKQLRNLKAEAEILLKKLRNDEFEIAIVGMEKAGKSTFANALMENNLLPAKDSRCTFTSTRIEYSGDGCDDSAIVSFYTTEEFDRDFKDKLRMLGFPNIEKYSFDTTNESVYLSIYEQEVTDDKKRAYSDSINADIIAVIKNAPSLSELLGRPDVNFAADRIRSGELAAYITDEAKARAVKQVIIHSKELSKMKNTVIFDVPGFNSPTELHKIQTRERMKSADAIIVVANGEHPSLTDEALKILRESDDEGNPLCDKLFVFANRTEQGSNIGNNINDTFTEWIDKKGFVSPSNKHKRIIFGSALAHLQRAGLDDDERKKALRDFEEVKEQMPHGDGIEEIRNKLAEYNVNERFEVLKRRINRINADILKTFSDIRNGHDNNITDSRSYSTEQVKLILGFTDDVRSVIKNNLRALREEIRSYMPSDKPLSKEIIEYISSNVTIENCRISDEIIDVLKKGSLYTGIHEDTGNIEYKVRELKFKEMYEDFSQNVINIADKDHISYSKMIIDIILAAIEVETSSPYYDDLKELLKNEISAYRCDLLTSDHSNEIYYQSLVERFSRNIYQVLITSPYSVDRLREFYENIDKFYGLSVFYKKTDDENDLSYINIAPKDQPLCMMLLFHHYANISDTLNVLSDKLCSITGLKEIPHEVWEYAKKTVYAIAGRTEEIIAYAEKAFAKLSGQSDEFRINLLKTTLSRLAESYEPCNIADQEAFIRYYENYHSSRRGGKLYSIDDFRADFDVDIQILQDVLINAFVRAISIETPFVAKETKSIDDIIDNYIMSKKFGDLISDNFWKIKYKETVQLDKQRREQEQNAAIIGEINGILDTLNN